MITNIQGLRFIAALLVCILHIGIFNDDHHVFSFGGAGVDLFFVISGFIMVVSSERLFGRPGAVGIFLYRRITRVVPLYWLATAVYVWLLWQFQQPITIEVPRLLADVFFLPITGMQPYLPVGWTLNYEMFFYLLLTIAVRFPQLVAVTMVSAAIFSAVALGMDGVVLEFVWGMVVGVLYARGWRPSFTVAGIILTLGVATILNPGSWVHAERAIYLGLPSMLIVLGAACLPQLPQSSWIGKTVKLLGDSSYAAYLTHWIFAWFVHGLPQPILVMLAITTAIGIHLVIERPLMAFFRERRNSPLAVPSLS